MKWQLTLLSFLTVIGLVIGATDSAIASPTRVSSPTHIQTPIQVETPNRLGPPNASNTIASLEDPDSTRWASVRGLSSSAFNSDFNQRKQAGLRVIDIDVNDQGRQPTYSAVWQENSDNRGWASLRNLTHEAFSQKWQEFRDQGYRLIDQESYAVNGQRYYAGVWVENKEGLGWVSYRNVTSDEFSEKFQTYRDQGFRMVDVEAYPMGNGIRYSAIWVKNPDNTAWAVHRDMSSDGFSERFKNFADEGFRLVDIESYQQNGQQRYAGIWVKNTNDRAWKARRDMSAQAFSNFWATYKDEGYRLTDFEAYPTTQGTRYAGVWRQNNDRVNWAHRSEVDQAVQAHLDQFKLPGISVAIAQNGQIVYTRGFGFADIAANEVAHSDTIFRLASVSKPITRALTMRLQEQGKLSLEDATLTHVPSLPANIHGGHTVEQLMNHRSGIHHYKGTNYQERCSLTVSNTGSWQDSSATQYSTATAATALFRNDALLFEPGSQDCYSTHAYTVLGAALEGASGLSFSNLVNQQLTQGLGLSTLRPEVISANRPDRAQIYQSKSSVNAPNQPASRDNLSWKYAGGGLEASSVDVAKFGMALLDHSFLSKASVDDAFNGGNYAHNGGWLGASSFLLTNADEDLVIVVLANQRNSDLEGSSSEALGRLLERRITD